MNIFVKIKNSIYNPKYYEEILEKPFSYSLKYYLVFALLFALVFTIVVTVRFIPVVNLMSGKAPQLANYFPQELTITVKDGKASTNVAEPYFIKVPQEYKNRQGASSDAVNLDNYVVIDTKNKFDLDTFYSYKTAALLTSNSIVYADNNGKVSIYSLSSVKSFTLNRGAIVGFVNKATPFLVYLYPIVFLGAYLVGYGVIMVKLVYLLIGALIIWLVVKIKGLKIGYKKSYQAGMHLMTAAIIITSILGAISNKLTFTYLFTILLVLATLLNIKKNNVKASAPTA